jgi:hypothetical protein
MLSTRSARLAATLLLTLLFGWTVRACRKGSTSPLPSPDPTVTTPVAQPQNNTFPDE